MTKYVPPKTWVNKTRTNKSAAVPYAYKPKEFESLELIPDLDMVPFVEEAMDYIDKGSSFREVSNWLSNAAGKKVSHQGISNIWRRHRGTKDNKRLKQLNKAKRKKAPKTTAEKFEAREKRKIADSKRKITLSQKKLKKHHENLGDEQQEAPINVHSFSDSLDHTAAAQQKREVVFAPNPGPQTEFLAASEREILYGGAAGGGKSYGLLADPLRYFGHKQFNGLILRRTNDELRELIWKSQEMYPKAFPGAKWAEKKSQWTFPSGAKLWLTYLEREQDVLRYQGQAFSYIGFDELSQHSTPFAWNYMRSRLRTTAPDLPIFMRATTNPGGPGHGWVKQMFIDPAPPNKAFTATDLESGKPMVYPEGHEREGEPLFQRRFIPASLYDNPYLTEGGEYEANLMSLPENQRRQLLDGDWAVADGAAFPEFRIKDHVVEPFDIPTDWRRFRSCDYGYSSYSAVHWYAIDPAFETLVVYRELYLSKHTGRALAHAVMEAEGPERMAYGMLDSSCWHNRGQIGPSIAEEMIGQGCSWRPSDRSAGARVAGRNRLHELLKVDEDTGLPGIQFFNTCRQIIADLPVIPSDPKGTDDIDPRYASDHAYDSIRYGIMSRPKAATFFDLGGGAASGYRPADNKFGY